MATNLNRPWTADDDKRFARDARIGTFKYFHLGGAKAQSIGGKGSHFHFARARPRRTTFGCFA